MRLGLRNNKQKRKLLNVGSASGTSSKWLKEFGEVISVDISRLLCTTAKNNSSEPVVCGALPNLPFSSQGFEVICAFDTIEHVKEYKRSVAELYRILKPEGLLFGGDWCYWAHCLPLLYVISRHRIAFKLSISSRFRFPDGCFVAF